MSVCSVRVQHMLSESLWLSIVDEASIIKIEEGGATKDLRLLINERGFKYNSSRGPDS